jgi:hypothetical protein
LWPNLSEPVPCGSFSSGSKRGLPTFRASLAGCLSGPPYRSTLAGLPFGSSFRSVLPVHLFSGFPCGPPSRAFLSVRPPWLSLAGCPG